MNTDKSSNLVKPGLGGVLTGNNEFVPMTRRYPNLRQKVLIKDSKIVQKLMTAWDVQRNEELLFNLFLRESVNLSDERYWEILRTVWIICGGLNNIQMFRLLFESKRPQKHYFSTPEEAKIFRELPDPVKVYRAANDLNDGGISWTTSEDYANKYREMFQKKCVWTATVEKSKIFAYINRNNEDEVLILGHFA